MPSDPADPNYDTCTYGPPVANTYPYPPGLPVPMPGDLNSYGCTSGDVFLEGTLKGGLTIGAENNINIIANTKYAGGVTGTDVLGLVANGAVGCSTPSTATRPPRPAT